MFKTIVIKESIDSIDNLLENYVFTYCWDHLGLKSILLKSGVVR